MSSRHVRVRALAPGAGRHTGDRVRVAVLAWNERSLRTVRRAGFREGRRLSTPDGREFVVLERPAAPPV